MANEYMMNYNTMLNFITDLNKICKKAVTKAAKKVAEKGNYVNADELVEAIGGAKFPKEYRQQLTKVAEKFGAAVGADKYDTDFSDIKLISDIPMELIGINQLCSWIGDALPKRYKKAKINWIESLTNFDC